MPLTKMITWTGTDKHPPLYYAALHFWADAFGESEVALRSLSAVAGATAIVLLATACWRVRGPVLAAIVSAFLLLNATQLYFSQEARMYALLGLLALAASLALAALIEKPSVPRLALYTGLLSAVVYTQYSGFVLAAVHVALIASYGVYALWRSQRREILIYGVLAFTATALLYIPWLSNFRQTVRLGASDVPEPSRQLVIDSLKGALGLGQAGDIWLLPALALLAIAVWCIARRWREPLPMCIGAIALVPVGQLIISVQSKPVFDLRQISPYIPGFAFLLGLGLAEAFDLVRLPVAALRVAGGAVLVVLAGVLVGYMYKDFSATYTRPPIEDWRTAAGELRDFHGPIYISASYTLAPLSYYYGTTPNVQSFGVWSPETQPVGKTEMIVISHQLEGRVLTALGTSVAIEGRRLYRGVTIDEVRVLHHVTLNVDVPAGDAAWSVNEQGYFQTIGSFAPFTCECEPDADGDGLADDSFSIVIEYLDAGRGQLQAFGTSSASVLASQPLTDTGQWRVLNVNVPAGTPVGTTFGLSSGIVLRRLQVIRTHLENADVFGSYQGTTRWILGSDGYVQSADSLSYIDSSLPLDADKDGKIDRAIRLELEYRGGDSNSLQIFGLQSGVDWMPIPQDSHVVRTDGLWRTIDVNVPKGASLQPRFYIGRGVVLRSIRFLPAEQ